MTIASQCVCETVRAMYASDEPNAATATPAPANMPPVAIADRWAGSALSADGGVGCAAGFLPFSPPGPGTISSSRPWVVVSSFFSPSEAKDSILPVTIFHRRRNGATTASRRLTGLSTMPTTRATHSLPQTSWKIPRLPAARLPLPSEVTGTATSYGSRSAGLICT